MNTPKITVITVCLNAERFLEQTIQSVAAQTYPEIEFIVVDGASHDRTRDIIKAHHNDIFRWMSEPDDGIADAMNKGLSMATGDYIMFLHSDDYLTDPDAISMAARHLDGQADIYAFDVIYSTARGSRRFHSKGFGWGMNFKTGLWHQGVFCRRELFDRIGWFDTGLSIAMDYDYFLRACRYGAKLQLIRKPVAVMRDTGISSRKDWRTLKRRFADEKRIHFRHCQSVAQRRLYGLYWLLYPPYRRLRAALGC